MKLGLILPLAWPHMSSALDSSLENNRHCCLYSGIVPRIVALALEQAAAAAAAATTPFRSGAARPRRRSRRGEVAAMGHPYAPAELEVPGYVPLQLSQGEILVSYIGASLFVLLAVWLISGRCRLSKTDRLLMCWWAFTGLTHILIEGPFVFTPNFFQKENPNFFDEVWKEYSKGDSRYVARDTATVTVEGITAVLEGPASLLAVYAIASRKSYSHILQFAVCLGQLYGCLVYFITAYLDGFNFWVSSFHFWAYFIGANSSWVVIPTLIAIRSWKKICAAFQVEKVKTK